VTTCDNLNPIEYENGTQDSHALSPCSDDPGTENKFIGKKVVTGCHVVTEALQRGEKSDNLPAKVVTEVVTDPAYRVVQAIHKPNVNTLRAGARVLSPEEVKDLFTRDNPDTTFSAFTGVDVGDDELFE